MTIRGRKKAMRAAIKKRIGLVRAGDREIQELAIRAAFPLLPGLQEAHTVLLFASHFAEEIDTRPLIAAMIDAGKTVLCPRVDAGARCLRLHQIRDPGRDFSMENGGIPEPREDTRVFEPTEVDWVLVPGLAFDDQGYRLGRGGGYYDRLLTRIRADCPCWSVCFEEQWVDAVPRELHDQRLDGILSRSRSFNANIPVDQDGKFGIDGL